MYNAMLVVWIIVFSMLMTVNILDGNTIGIIVCGLMLAMDSVFIVYRNKDK